MLYVLLKEVYIYVYSVRILLLYNGIYTLARYSHYLPTFTLGGFLAFSACQGAHRIDNDGLTFINSVTDTVIEKKNCVYI